MKNLSEIISKQFAQSVTKINRDSYSDLITDIREDLEEGFDTEILSSGFIDQLAEVINDKSLDEFNAYTYFWSQLLDQLIHLIQIHEDLNEEESEELLQELQEFWQSSEFKESYNELLEQKAEPVKASDSLMTLLENQILGFFHLHLSSKEYKIDDVILYNAIPEIGDTEETLFVGLERRLAHFEMETDLFPLFSIKSIHSSRASMDIEINTDTYEMPLSEHKNLIAYDIANINMLCLESKFTSLKDSLNNVLQKIKTIDLDLYSNLGSYTSSIVPLEGSSELSFAHPSYLGFSNIANGFKTDNELAFVIFSLNGQHQINSMLAEQELAFETDEIYYNPWLNEKSNLSLVLKSYFGNFWGFRALFALYNDSKFTVESDIELLAQTYYKLAYSLRDLATAFEAGQITPAANEMIQLIGDELANAESLILDIKTDKTNAFIESLKNQA